MGGGGGWGCHEFVGVRVCDRMVLCNFKPSFTVILIIHCYMQEKNVESCII